MKYSKSRPQSTQLTLVISMASLAFILALFFQLFVSVKSWGDEIKSQMKVYVYLSDSLSTSDLAATITYFKTRPYLGQKELKLELEFKSKAQIASEFLKSSQEDYQSLLGEENPFKNCLILGIKEEFKNEAAFKKIVTEIQTRPEVYEVTYPNTFIGSLLGKIKAVGYVGLILIVILVLFVYVQLANNIRLHIHGNRVLIKTMQLLGSTNGFIQKPYLLNALLVGFLGGLIGFVLADGAFYYFSTSIPEISSLFFEINNQVQLVLVCVGFCTFFSVIASFFSISKYLKIQHTNLF
ncbi:cell division protein FtsX [Aquirufa antheringensis]|jgi:cell division transport system permease protein|uniref:cell division protein FtsX n=1 Tax=Aquirufa antheringensis TaxID=2516559 RepID=UPI0022A8BD6A|nr:permease-like cell division protein FtsX [Aquirufa antheringensis]MCZ2485994.1 FtsX-like permease family protein [Aquirufa antheringensis]MCZ2486315.1 FtsX-like permease family protein [Aquirufa antheringensis]MCZ2488904.1 FtsX-like permease family protein [Aquirufa antheringensis]